MGPRPSYIAQKCCFWNSYISIASRWYSIYRGTHQYLNKFSNGFWDNQWFGRNQIYLKLKLETLQFMSSIKNLKGMATIDLGYSTLDS
jgi:hypothetical protein